MAGSGSFTDAAAPALLAFRPAQTGRRHTRPPATMPHGRSVMNLARFGQPRNYHTRSCSFQDRGLPCDPTMFKQDRGFAAPAKSGRLCRSSRRSPPTQPPSRPRSNFLAGRWHSARYAKGNDRVQPVLDPRQHCPADGFAYTLDSRGQMTWPTRRQRGRTPAIRRR